MSFAIHGGKSKAPVKTRMRCGVRILMGHEEAKRSEWPIVRHDGAWRGVLLRLIPLDGAPKKRRAAARMCRSPSTHSPTRVRLRRQSIRGDAQCTEQNFFRVCSLRLCAVLMCTMRGSFMIRWLFCSVPPVGARAVCIAPVALVLTNAAFISWIHLLPVR